MEIDGGFDCLGKEINGTGTVVGWKLRTEGHKKERISRTCRGTSLSRHNKRGMASVTCSRGHSCNGSRGLPIRPATRLTLNPPISLCLLRIDPIPLGDL